MPPARADDPALTLPRPDEPPADETPLDPHGPTACCASHAAADFGVIWQ
jgi:hypothetical protein